MVQTTVVLPLSPNPFRFSHRERAVTLSRPWWEEEGGGREGGREEGRKGGRRRRKGGRCLLLLLRWGVII